MKISLQVIWEKLCLDAADGCLNNPHRSAFADVQLLGPATKTLQAGTLYIGVHYPAQATFFQGCGLILLNEPRNAPSDVLFIRKKIDLIELFNRIVRIMTEIREKHDTLTLSIIQKKGFQKIIEDVYALCENPVYLVDSSFKVMGMYGPEEMSELSIQWNRMKNTGYLSYDVVMNLIASNELHSMDAETSATMLVSKYFGTPFISYCLKYKGKVHGRLFIIGMFKHITPADLELTNLFGPLVLDAFRLDPDFQKTRGHYYEHFVIDLIEGKTFSQEHLHKQLKALNLTMDSYFTVVKINPQTQNELEIELIAREMENFKSCKPVRYHDSVVALFPAEQYQQAGLFQKLKNLAQKMNCQIGVSDEKPGINAIHIQYQQASAAISLNETLEAKEHPTSYQDVALFHLFNNLKNRDLLDPICHGGVLRLLAFDEQNNSNLVETLDVYLKCERHSQLTARMLHIHRNSLSYRIEKINEVFRFNLDDHIERERILLTLSIIHYLKHHAE